MGCMKIGGERYGKAFKDLQLEILPHLDDPETELEITVEIQRPADGGFSEEKQRIVTENAQSAQVRAGRLRKLASEGCAE